jgi:hypothetical protein
MAKPPAGSSPTQQRVPRMQLLLDDVFLLLIVGFVVPTVLYIAWGLVSMLSVPPFPR